MTGRKVAFVSDNSLTIPHPHTPLRGFCQIFESNDGCRISLVLQDGCLLRTGVDALKHRVSSGMGISLADVLIQYELSVKQKLSLAHSVALSFWKYYESQLMHRAWTSDTIWFMPEPDLLDGSKRLPLRTYIGFYPEAAECSYDASEFVMTNFLIHRCPRIQYLALVLLQIGLGSPFRLPSSDKQNFQLNTDYSIASAKLEELRSVPWVNFVHKDIFTGAIEKCLKFDVLTGKDKNSDTSGSLASRRRLIYEMVVSPLERLNKSFRRTNAQVDYLSIKQPIPVPESEESHSSIPTSLSATNNSVEDDARAEVFRMRPTDRLGFETAIICALTLEADAVEALFDHHWEDDMSYGKAPGDPNAYSIGVMGRHNVVLVHMSGMGKSAAATAAAACRISFPKINLAILVGVCGAVPVIHDTGERIDLGDVILSNGVIQYDFGRQYPDRFERKDTLLDSMGRAGLEIRSTLNKVKGLRGKEVLKNRMAHYLDKLSKKPSLQANYPTMRDSKASERPRRYPVETADQGVRYQDGVVSGRRLGQSSVNAPNPAIHFGLIASGDTVMKSERQRDEIARRENTIAFEMEGAAVWENFPTLVIKGACDYADSHKTKEFQPYAAATAAACTRAFLDSWESS
jgi:nucleoside phosphorylase